MAGLLIRVLNSRLMTSCRRVWWTSVFSCASAVLSLVRSPKGGLTLPSSPMKNRFEAPTSVCLEALSVSNQAKCSVTVVLNTQRQHLVATRLIGSTKIERWAHHLATRSPRCCRVYISNHRFLGHLLLIITSLTSTLLVFYISLSTLNKIITTYSSSPLH